VRKSDTTVSPASVRLRSNPVWDALSPILVRYSTNTTDSEP
jgi:hypothetical protein